MSFSSGITALSAVAAIVGFIFSLIRSKLAERSLYRQPNIEEKISMVRSQLRRTAAQISEVEAEIKARLILLEQARINADSAKELASISSEQAKVVGTLIETSVHRSYAKGRFWSFIAGLLFAIPTGILGNYLYDLWIR